MEEQEQWVHYTKIDWNDEKFNFFSIDTRDFHCGYNNAVHKNLSTLKNTITIFFHTEQEVKDLLNRLFKESGGDGEWRMIDLQTVKNWRLKYIRIYRTEFGFLVCDSYSYALRKSILAEKVDQEHLNFH